LLTLPWPKENASFFIFIKLKEVKCASMETILTGLMYSKEPNLVEGNQYLDNSPWIDMSLHFDILFWFRANKSLFLLLNAACLVVTDKLDHIMLYTLPWSRFELTTSVVIGTDCTGSCKSNYHTMTTTCTLSYLFWYVFLVYMSWW
jgi:hypothetical protein